MGVLSILQDLFDDIMLLSEGVTPSLAVNLP